MDRRARVVVVLAALAVVLGAGAAGLVRGGQAERAADPPIAEDPRRLVPGIADTDAAFDPLAYDPAAREEFEARAARGYAHVLYARSPGGAVATAERVARWRPLVEQAAGEHDVDADLLEALIFLESAGRPEVRAGDVEGAVGLTQILAETGQNLLDMRIDVAASEKLRRRIVRAERRGQRARAERLRAQRRRVDERYDPRKALAATGRYLQFAREQLGRDDLAFVGYHMGVGNLQAVLGDYGRDDVPYTQVFFDSSPLRNPRTWARLSSLGDESATYYFKLFAAREILRLHREQPAELDRLAALHAAKASSEEVLHPADSTSRYVTTAQLDAAYGRGEIVGLPPARTLATVGLRVDRRMGELARRSERYRGLRPDALALLVYLGRGVQAIAGDDARLTVTSTVRDNPYQARLIRRTREATQAYSLHTTGWSFDIARDYPNRRTARAFQFWLDRLQALSLITWVREPGAIHVTVAEDARVLRGLLERVGSPPP